MEVNDFEMLSIDVQKLVFIVLRKIKNPTSLKTAGYYYMVNPFSVGTVFIRQTLTYKDGPHTGRMKIFLIAVDP